MKSVTENQEKVYDLFDKMQYIGSMMNYITCEVDKTGTMSIALQSMLGKVYRYQPCSSSELAKIYSIDHKNTIKYISELEKRGYVKKELVDRKKLISLTEEGAKLHHELSTIKGQLLDQMFEKLGQEGIMNMNKSFDEMIELIEAFKASL